MDGTNFNVPKGTQVLVADMKRTIGALHEIPHFAMELFKTDREEGEPLNDDDLLRSEDGTTLFVLPKAVSDRLFLEFFFKSTNGNEWYNKTGWEDWEQQPYSAIREWYGVKADAAEGRVTVTKLRLYNNNLSGHIPEELGNLNELITLNLSKNQLSGPIPKELEHLNKLRILDLSENQLSGHIPKELGMLSALENLYMNNNELTGFIPLRTNESSESENNLITGKRTRRSTQCFYKNSKS